uniref:G-protein coupled receptors family 1 profile domain-containing protein n=1 Tax=Globodera rostochiensis TaxID=31243 RepID=A0A914GUZ3_GLORO
MIRCNPVTVPATTVPATTVPATTVPGHYRPGPLPSRPLRNLTLAKPAKISMGTLECAWTGEEALPRSQASMEATHLANSAS